jgi:hypothetical protein
MINVYENKDPWNWYVLKYSSTVYIDKDELMKIQDISTSNPVRVEYTSPIKAHMMTNDINN